MTLKIKNAVSDIYKLMETPYDSLEKAAKGETKLTLLSRIKNNYGSLLYRDKQRFQPDQ